MTGSVCEKCRKEETCFLFMQMTFISAFVQNTSSREQYLQYYKYRNTSTIVCEQ